ncbi:hypothetical protein V5799_005820 [Amblyomma americanum]|uniref:Peptidase S1 domain-containing protein n=1 Tax=Amblyomma americanum TaxID=6943 RepID=A0AAQ4DY59_AMBAM
MTTRRPWTRRQVDVVRHPDYDLRSNANDIALLVLSKPVTWNRFVQPVCLPFGPLASETLEGNRAYVTGWGAAHFGEEGGSDTESRARAGGAGSSELRQGQVPVWTEADCKKAYERLLHIGEAHLCAGDIRGGTDACQGDSGGPLQLLQEGRYYVVGIVSGGKGCGTPGFPGVYTRVSSHLDWLRNELGAAQ